MKHSLYLKCCKCGQESDRKEYDCSKEKLAQIMKIGEWALIMIQHIMCPYCGALFSVKLLKEEK